MSADFLTSLLEHRAELLRFVERRVGSPATAEDILQEALLRSVDRLGSVEAPVRKAWFYRVLENAVTDHHRRAATARRGLGQLEGDLRDAAVTPDDAPARTCQCVTRLKSELKPEYAQALKRIEEDDLPVKDFAAEAGLTRSNAAVRVFRAREALRRKVVATCGHCAAAGCVDCSCVSHAG